ncbi:hypothetical protein BD309DRAFT_817875, partial [Dichomitus squalens]
ARPPGSLMAPASGTLRTATPSRRPEPLLTALRARGVGQPLERGQRPRGTAPSTPSIRDPGRRLPTMLPRPLGPPSRTAHAPHLAANALCRPDHSQCDPRLPHTLLPTRNARSARPLAL